MFGSFRKHQQWIWILGVIVIIPSFVIFFSPDAKWNRGLRGGSDKGLDLGSFNGRPIGRDEYMAANRETKINYFMRTGGKEWPGNDEQTRRKILDGHEPLSFAFL